MNSINTLSPDEVNRLYNYSYFCVSSLNFINLFAAERVTSFGVCGEMLTTNFADRDRTVKSVAMDSFPLVVSMLCFSVKVVRDPTHNSQGKSLATSSYQQPYRGQYFFPLHVLTTELANLSLIKVFTVKDLNRTFYNVLTLKPK